MNYNAIHVATSDANARGVCLAKMKIVGVESQRRDTGALADVRKGVALMLVATLVMGTSAVVVKWLGAVYPAPEILFFRSLFGAVPIFAIAWRTAGIRTLRTTRLRAHLTRAVAGTGSLLLLFMAYARMPIADATAVSHPLFVAALSGPVLGEAVGWQKWIAVLMGLAGVALMLRPGSGTFESAALLALAGSLLWALSVLMTRELSKSENSASIVFYFLLVCVTLTGALLLFGWRSPTLSDFLLLAMLGIASGIGQFCSTQAYRAAPAALIAPLYYTTLIWAVVFGYWLWGDVPDWAVWAGSGIVIASNLYLFRSELRASRDVADHRSN